MFMSDPADISTTNLAWSDNFVEIKTSLHSEKQNCRIISHILLQTVTNTENDVHNGVKHALVKHTHQITILHNSCGNVVVISLCSSVGTHSAWRFAARKTCSGHHSAQVNNWNREPSYSQCTHRKRSLPHHVFLLSRSEGL